MMKQNRFSFKQKILLTVDLLLVIVFCILLFRWLFLAGLLDSQHAAERWQGANEQKFAQATLYLPKDSDFTEDDIYAFREDLSESMVAMGLNPEDGTVLYTDAWSGTGELTAKGSYGSANTTVIAIGGNWFHFHPMELRSGSYINGSELMHDRVVLSEEAAFQLFGAIDVAGMEITIADQPYLVAGVVAMEDDKLSKKVRSAKHPYMFVYADAFSEMDITCYELVSAEPLAAVTYGKLLELGDPYDDSLTVDNSRRFYVNHIDDLIWRFGDRSVVKSGTAFPYWENAARVIEDHLGLSLVIMVFAAIPPVGTAVYFADKGIRNVKAEIRKRREEF